MTQNQLKQLRQQTHSRQAGVFTFTYPANETTYYNNAYSLVLSYNMDHPEAEIDASQFLRQKPESDKKLIDTAAVNLTRLGFMDPDNIAELVVEFYRESGLLCSQVKHNLTQPNAEQNQTLLVCDADEQGKKKFVSYLRLKGIL